MKRSPFSLRVSKREVELVGLVSRSGGSRSLGGQVSCLRPPFEEETEDHSKNITSVTRLWGLNDGLCSCVFMSAVGGN